MAIRPSPTEPPDLEIPFTMKMVAGGATARELTSLPVHYLLATPGAPEVEVIAEYRCSDPWAVRFDIGGERWVMSRKLVLDGLGSARWLGEADVRTVSDKSAFSVFSPSFAVFGLMLVDGRDNHAVVFRGDHATVLGFIRRTYSLVPDGEETRYVDMDAEIRRLLT